MVLSFWPATARSVVTCDAPVAVCEFVQYVLKLKIGRRQGNAVYIAPGLVVTNRHILLASETIFVETRLGKKYRGWISPSAYEGDLVLLSVDGLDLGPPPLSNDDVSVGTRLFVVVGGPSDGGSPIYSTGSVILPTASGFALSRLQHDVVGGGGARAQHATS